MDVPYIETGYHFVQEVRDLEKLCYKFRTPDLKKSGKAPPKEKPEHFGGFT